MSTESIIRLADVGRLAVELHAASLARKAAKNALRDKYAEFAGGRRVEINTDEYREMQAYAAAEIKAHARAKLDEYNLKRKLDRAIRAYKEGRAI